MCHERWALHFVMKRNVVYIYICSFSTKFYAVSVSDTRLRKQKSVCIPNFDKISQSKNLGVHDPVPRVGTPMTVLVYVIAMMLVVIMLRGAAAIALQQPLLQLLCLWRRDGSMLHQLFRQ